MAQIAHYVAEEKSYYKEEGLDARFVVMSAPLTARALLGGNVQFSGASGAALPAVLAGTPLKIVFSSFYKPMFWLYTRRDIHDVKGLKGKRVAVSGLGSGPAILLMEILQRSGLEGGRDVTILSMGITSSRYAALTTGSVDAAILIPPFTFMAADSGFREMVSFIKEDFVELQGSIIVRPASLQSDPAAVEKFLRGTLKGLRYAREHRSPAIAILARRTKTNPMLAARDYDLSRPGMTRDGTVDDRMQKSYLELGAKRLGFTEILPNEKVFDFSIAKKVGAQLDINKWHPN
jgi:NitT/TauT family transport system substrate-binding protein